ncbi:Protein translation factor SUI1-like protein [Hibiscus syriacus]|uniref:Protein translation factor SUI1-like protein n=2 Tax=Hibiscus syriacus TaxID=106335 RepID=A0A6A3B9D5_HIBSY|nr:Protein translation factor SUI1-like protein [Hibiscus syriacus]
MWISHNVFGLLLGLFGKRSSCFSFVAKWYLGCPSCASDIYDKLFLFLMVICYIKFEPNVAFVYHVQVVSGLFDKQSFMSDLDVQIPTAFDPFADANAEDSSAGGKEYVHIRVQQRNGRKSLTTVQGLKKDFSYNKILKDLKKEFCCNGTVVQDPELGQVIQLQGDQRKNVSTFLVQAGIVKKENIKIHGF